MDEMDLGINDEKIVSEKRKKKLGVPGGSEFYTKKVYAEEAAKKLFPNGKYFMGAWQLEGKGYCFGVYESYNVFMKYLMEKPVHKRFGYEIIPGGTQCNLFFDFEYYGKEDETDERILYTVKVISDDLFQKHGVKFVPQISKGSRMTKDGMKISYHIVYSGVIYSNIDGNALKNYAIHIKRLLGEHDDDGKLKKHGIDMEVYTKGRPLRTVMSCKREHAEYPLHNVTMDSSWHSDIGLSDHVYADDEKGVLGNFSITEHNNDCHKSVFIESNAIAIEYKMEEKKDKSSTCKKTCAIRDCHKC